VNQHELFHLTNTGELKLKCDISEFLGKTFILNIENSANDLDQHHTKIYASLNSRSNGPFVNISTLWLAPYK
jgi:hypothetical protein